MKTTLPLKPNTLYHGDCLDIMQPWANEYPTGCVDLIYLDPPFNSNANYNTLYGKDRKGKPLDERAQFTAFKDTWYWSGEAAERVRNISRAEGHAAHKAICGLVEMLPKGGMLAYLSYMAERLAVMRILLKDTGSIYLHCDPTASHYLKTIMDCVFGVKNFRNEIIWCYTGPNNSKKHFQRKHDTILFYSKTQDSLFYADAVRVKYKTENPLHLSRGFGNPSPDDVKKLKKQLSKSKVPTSWWADGFLTNISAWRKERLGYPTQKPLALLDRIIKASSNEGDVVLDPFCGCGTTMEAAWKLKRKFLGIDISPYAITRVCRDRLKNAAGVSVQGLPTDMQSATDLARADGYVFEHWAISCLDGFAPNDSQVADGGIDGRGRLLNPPADKDGKAEKGRCVAQVKGGHFTPDSLRAFLSQILGGKASVGLFITLKKTRPTQTMREVVSDAGTFQPRGSKKRGIITNSHIFC